MLTFNDFILESKYEFMFHGTSSKYRDDIKKYGLMPSRETHKRTKQKGVYLTTEIGLARREANFTVKGENDEEGAGGSPVIVVVDRAKISNLKKDDEYHAYNKTRDITAFWTPDSIPPEAIIDVVSSTSSKYRDANTDKITKQIGLFDKEGNKIVDRNGNIPEIVRSDRHLYVYLGSDSGYPDPHGNWTTNPDSYSLEDVKYKLAAHGRPEEFEIIDQMSDEVILKPSSKVLRTTQTVPEKFNSRSTS